MLPVLRVTCVSFLTALAEKVYDLPVNNGEGPLNNGEVLIS